MICCYQSVSMDVANTKKLVSECVDLAGRLQSSAVCSGVARVTLDKQIRELQTRAENVDDRWNNIQTNLETELSHLQKYYTLYQVCDDENNSNSRSTQKCVQNWNKW